MGDVVNMFSKSRAKPSGAAAESKSVVSEESLRDGTSGTSGVCADSINFEELARKNAEIQARLRKERASANRNVLKSYRIK